MFIHRPVTVTVSLLVLARVILRTEAHADKSSSYCRHVRLEHARAVHRHHVHMHPIAPSVFQAAFSRGHHWCQSPSLWRSTPYGSSVQRSESFVYVSGWRKWVL